MHSLYNNTDILGLLVQSTIDIEIVVLVVKIYIRSYT